MCGNFLAVFNGAPHLVTMYSIVQIDDGLSFLPKHQINFRRDFSSSMFKGRIRTRQFKSFIRGIFSFLILLLTLNLLCLQSPKSLQNHCSLKSLEKVQSNNTNDNSLNVARTLNVLGLWLQDKGYLSGSTHLACSPQKIILKCPQCYIHIWWDFLICQNYSHQARQHRLKHSSRTASLVRNCKTEMAKVFKMEYFIR